MLPWWLNRNYIEVKYNFNLIVNTEVVNKGNHNNKFFENKDVLNIHYKEY